MTDYMFVYDDGHGWLQVPKIDLKKYPIEPSKYSYQRGKYLYLEEDSDMVAFLKLFKAKNGYEPSINRIYFKGSCYVRRMEHT